MPPLQPSRAEVDEGKRYAQKVHASLIQGRGTHKPSPAQAVGVRALAIQHGLALRLAAVLLDTIQQDLVEQSPAGRMTPDELRTYLAAHLTAGPSTESLEAARAALERHT